MARRQTEEDVVSFELAKLLKEKGFEEYTVLAYDKNGDITISCSIDDGEDEFYAPSLSIVQKWIKNKFDIDVLVYKVYDSYTTIDNKQTWGTYGEALEEGLFNVLKKVKSVF